MGIRAAFSRPAYFPLLAISVLVLTAGVYLAIREPRLIEPYFGFVPPLIAMPVVYLIGWPALIYLSERGYFTLSRPQSRRRGLRFATLLALGFSVSVTVADLALRFPRDINVSLPAALLFYPVMAYVVALVVHAVPLALLIPLAQRLLKRWDASSRIWVCIVIVASLEAVFQFASTSGGPALAVFVLAQLFLFGIAELCVFRRYDFVSMYVFRIVYYAYWHIIWGTLRHALLF